MSKATNTHYSRSLRVVFGIVAMGGALLVGALASVQSAQAQSASCSRLESQLIALERRGSKKQKRAFSRSIRAQKKQIKSVSSKMSGYGCASRRKFFAREAHPSCRSLRNTLGKMQSNLKTLEKGATGGSSSTKRERSKIKRAMRANLCGARTASRDGIRRTSIMQQIFGGEANRRRKEQAKRDTKASRQTGDQQGKRLENASRLKNYNTVRTVCVRTCDGYYFPVSFSTSGEGMEGDAQACNNLCPGRNMQLYYHKTSTQWADDMVSVDTEEPYSALPNAFAFRKSYNPSCACNYRLVERKKQIFPMEPELPKIAENQSVTTGKIGTPQWRDMPDEDILQGTAKPNSTPIPANIPQPRVEMSQNRRVRIIGESFFPAQ